MAETAVKGSEPGRSVVARVSAVLSALITADTQGRSASEIAREAGLAVPTAHRLLTELGQHGLTTRAPGSKRWTLGPMALGLGATAQRQMSLLDLARPFLRHVTEQTRETSVLVVRDGLHATYVDFVEGPQRLTLRERVGMRLPLDIGASRLAILAHLPDAERDAVLDDLRAAGRPVADGVRESCVRIREQGYAVTYGAVTAGACGVAVPVLAGDGTVACGLMLAVPEVRCGERALQDFVAVLRENAAALSQRLPSEAA